MVELKGQDTDQWLPGTKDGERELMTKELKGTV